MKEIVKILEKYSESCRDFGYNNMNNNMHNISQKASRVRRRQFVKIRISMHLIEKGIHFAITWPLQIHLDIKRVLVSRLSVMHLCAAQLLTLRN